MANVQVHKVEDAAPVADNKTKSSVVLERAELRNGLLAYIEEWGVIPMLGPGLLRLNVDGQEIPSAVSTRCALSARGMAAVMGWEERGREMLTTRKAQMPNQDWIGWFDKQLAALDREG